MSYSRVSFNWSYVLDDVDTGLPFRGARDMHCRLGSWKHTTRVLHPCDINTYAYKLTLPEYTPHQIYVPNLDLSTCSYYYLF